MNKTKLYKSVLLLLSAFLVTNLSSAELRNEHSADNIKRTHGTINIVLGNRNALVAVTDSNLTAADGSLFKYQAPKLFRLDDKTICTIAGYYSAYGPEFEDKSYPVTMLISHVIDRYPGHSYKNASISQKADLLIGMLQFSLQLTENVTATVAKSKGSPILPTKLYLTVAGYDGDKFSVKQIVLEPEISSSGVLHFVPKIASSIGPCQNTFLVTKGFYCALAGLPEVAKNILESKDPDSQKVPEVKKYLQAIESGQADALSVDDLLALAKYIKERTATYYENKYVGGETEYAKLSDDKLIFVEPVGDLPIPEALPFNFVEDDDLTGPVWGGAQTPSLGGISPTAIIGVFVINAKFQNLLQPLDKKIITQSSFKDCLLTYSGDPMTVFDASNKVSGGKLLISPEVDPQSPFLHRFNEDFPNITIVRTTFSYPQGWLEKMR
jgi:hypothetical protein